MDYYEGEDLATLSERSWKHLALKQLRFKQKSLKKLWALSSAIDDIAADIYMLIEVGGRESLTLFNQHFLNNAYEIHFIESNSKRSIDLAFLVRKGSKFQTAVFSHRDKVVEVQAYQGTFRSRFSRDVAELHVLHNSQLQLVVLLTHLKSQISTDHDLKGRDTRRAEAQALTALYNELRQKHPQVPFVVGGDLNAELISPELESLLTTDLKDFHDILNTPLEDRTSLVHFDHKGKPKNLILDYLLVSPELHHLVDPQESKTYRYKSFYDIPHPVPKTMSERWMMPSDHYPVILNLRPQNKTP